MPSARPVVADSHSLIREGLGALLKACDDIKVVGYAADGPQALASIETLHPHILLLDAKLLDASGAELLSRIRTGSPVTGLLILSDSHQNDGAIKVLRYGAKGYLPKGVNQQELLRAIQVTVKGEIWADRKVITQKL